MAWDCAGTADWEVEVGGGAADESAGADVCGRAVSAVRASGCCIWLEDFLEAANQVPTASTQADTAIPINLLFILRRRMGANSGSSRQGIEQTRQGGRAGLLVVKIHIEKIGAGDGI
jgi:hypothetical protein